MKFLLLLSLLISGVFAFNVDISNSTISNGKTLLIEFKKEKNLVYDKIVLGKKTYKIFNHPIDKTKLYALIPVSYYQKPKNEKLEVHYKEKENTKTKILFLSVVDGKYKKEKINVQGSKVNLNKEDKKRAAREYSQAMKIYNSISEENYILSKFILPMESKITSDFGKARVYNDTLKGYHSGTDFRAKIGTPIIASNDGIVVLVQDRFYSGGSVIIDHGHGIYTCYYHMSKFDVKKGERVKKAQIIGLSGVSGRVTGPHLHFSVRVGSEQVDPLQLIELINKNLLRGI